LLLGEPTLDQWIHYGRSGPQFLHLPRLRQSLPDLPPAARGSVLRLKVGNGTSVRSGTLMLIHDLQRGCMDSGDRIVRKHLNQHDPRLVRQRQVVIIDPLAGRRQPGIAHAARAATVSTAGRCPDAQRNGNGAPL
jgi:hypothetical protein